MTVWVWAWALVRWRTRELVLGARGALSGAHSALAVLPAGHAAIARRARRVRTGRTRLARGRVAHTCSETRFRVFALAPLVRMRSASRRTWVTTRTSNWFSVSKRAPSISMRRRRTGMRLNTRLLERDDAGVVSRSSFSLLVSNACHSRMFRPGVIFTWASYEYEHYTSRVSGASGSSR